MAKPRSLDSVLSVWGTRSVPGAIATGLSLTKTLMLAPTTTRSLPVSVLTSLGGSTRITNVNNLDNSISLRPATGDDGEFLLAVFQSSRGDDLRELGWEEDRIGEFLRMQFEAQKRLDQSEYQQADDQIVLRAGQLAGRLTMERRDHEVRCVDLALLPEHRNSGIGTFLIRQLQNEARLGNKPLRLGVIRYSRAVSLFERLGFVRTSETGTHFQMEWLPD
jgi:ribosomal protein S18 acetylase RimI-like enzyme